MRSTAEERAGASAVTAIACAIMVIALASGLYANTAAEPPHPYLLFNASDVSAIRAKYNSAAFTAHRNLIDIRGKELKYYVIVNGNKTWDSTSTLGYGTRVHLLGSHKRSSVYARFPWNYLFTGDTVYKQLLLDVVKDEFDRIAQGINLFPVQYRYEFYVGERGTCMALAYDLLHPEINAEQRQGFVNYLNQAIECYKNAEKPTFGWDNNIGTMYFSGVGMAALLLFQFLAISRWYSLKVMQVGLHEIFLLALGHRFPIVTCVTRA
jgi:hypothetical protein